jgi:hypothetical protein
MKWKIWAWPIICCSLFAIANTRLWFTVHDLRLENSKLKSGNCSEEYARGKIDGALVIVNIDRQRDNLPVYGSYKEFLADIDKQKEELGETIKYLDDMMKKREADEKAKAGAAKKHPEPWRKQ